MAGDGKEANDELDTDIVKTQEERRKLEQNHKSSLKSLNFDSNLYAAAAAMNQPQTSPTSGELTAACMFVPPSTSSTNHSAWQRSSSLFIPKFDPRVPKVVGAQT